MNKRAEYLINTLGLQKHPEGGYFREFYRSEELLRKESLPPRYEGDRNIATSIYYLLVHPDISRFHKLKSDEMWHFYEGSAITLHMMTSDGALTSKKLGSAIDKGESYQILIPHGCYFAAEVKKQAFALMGCSVAPGFDFRDFELADRITLEARYPVYRDLIRKFC